MAGSETHNKDNMLDSIFVQYGIHYIRKDKKNQEIVLL